jgi:hypothetical protein
MGVQVQEITPGDGEYKLSGVTVEFIEKIFDENFWGVGKKCGQIFHKF